MLQHMSCRMRKSVETSLGPGAQACPTSFLGQPVPSKRKSLLMRKQMELLRQGCKTLRLQAEGHARGHSSSASRSGYGPQLHSRPQRSGKANNRANWTDKIFQARMFDETQRSLQTLEGSTSREAYNRANPPEPAHPRGRPSSVHCSKSDFSWPRDGISGGSARHTAVAGSAATQASSTEFQEAVQETESEYDLHSPTVNHLAAMVRAQQKGQLVCLNKSLQEWAWFSSFVWMASKVTQCIEHQATHGVITRSSAPAVSCVFVAVLYCHCCHVTLSFISSWRHVDPPHHLRCLYEYDSALTIERFAFCNHRLYQTQMTTQIKRFHH